MKLVYTTLLCASLFALNSCNQTPQENAQKQEEIAIEKAENAADKASDFANKAANNSIKAMIYSDMAAANNAVAQIKMPPLSNNNAKKDAKDLANAIVARINAKTEEEVNKAEDKIQEERNKAEKSYQDGKISSADRDAILKYGDDMVNAALASIGVSTATASSDSI